MPYYYFKGMFKIRFYNISEDYINYLKKVDRQVPNVKYDTVNKFVCGVVLKVGEFSYYAPISSKTQKQRTNILITNKAGKIISSIKFSFMIPVPIDVLTELNFDEIRKSDAKYADLLEEEYFFCKYNAHLIEQKALNVYEIGCNKDHFLNYTCCNFKKLEGAMLLYEK